MKTYYVVALITGSHYSFSDEDEQHETIEEAKEELDTLNTHGLRWVILKVTEEPIL